MSYIIDTHAHIYDQSFDEDMDGMLGRANEVGVGEIWMPNCNSETIEKMLSVELMDPQKYKAMMGLHPCYVSQNYEVELKLIESWLSERIFIMIGEIGLDYYWDLSFEKEQKIVLNKQLDLAAQYKLPICIHSRNSKDGSKNAILDVCEIIGHHPFKGHRGIFHCFSGNAEEAQTVLALGFHLGIGGLATFKNGGLDGFLSTIPLERVVLETDAPYLAPVPHRGKRNEVSYIKLVADRLATIYQCSVDKIIDQTTINAQTLIQ